MDKLKIYGLISYVIIGDGNLYNLRQSVNSLLFNSSEPFEIIVTNISGRTADQLLSALPPLYSFICCRSFRCCTELFYTLSAAEEAALEIVQGDKSVIVDSGRFLTCCELQRIALSDQHFMECRCPKFITSGQYDKCLVSIIVPVFNNLEYTKKALLAVFNNTVESYELIVVDNASTDGTSEFLSNLKKSFPSPFCRNIKVIVNSANLGFAKANNQAAVMASGNYLLFLNNDTEVQSGWLTALIAAFTQNDKCVIAGSRLLYPDYSIQHAGVAFENGGVQHLYQHFSCNFLPALETKYLQAVTAACMLVRTDFYRQSGGFDEAFINCFEDTDLCLRAVDCGYLVSYQPDSVVIHHESKSKGRKDREEEAGRLLGRRWLSKIRSDADTLLAQSGLGYCRHQEGLVLDYLVPEEGISGFYRQGVESFNQKDYPAAWHNLRRVYDLLSTEAPAGMLEMIDEVFINLGVKRCSIDQIQAGYRFYQAGLTSIIMPVFNNLDYTRNAVKAVLSETVALYELIIIDNNSTDGSYEFLETLKKQSLTDTGCTEIKIIHNEKNRNFAGANNQGADIACGDFLLCLNNDTKVTAGWLERLLSTVKNQHRTAMGGAKLIYADNSIQHAGVVSAENCDIPFHFMQHAAFDHPAVNQKRNFTAVTAACTLISHTAFDLAGGYNEEFINCFEDIDLCYKLGNLGLKIVYEPEAVVFHYESKTQGRKDNIDHSAKILRKLWQSTMTADAEQLYRQYNLNCLVDQTGRQINIDFADLPTNTRLQKALACFEKCEYLNALELIYPIYQLSPEKQPNLVYQVLFICLEYAENLEKASEVLCKLLNYFPDAGNLKLKQLFSLKYGV